jgi:hypothetical protein
MNKQKYDFTSLLQTFQIQGVFESASPYGTGHINDTFLAVFRKEGKLARYILQRLNHSIFKNVPALMNNIERVCSHAQARIKASGRTDCSRRCLTLVPTHENAAFHQDAEGNFWRVYLFIENATGYDIAQNEKQAYEAARAFGEFQNLLADLPGDRLYETIPNFHNTPKRFEAFEKALAENSHNRADLVRTEIDFAIKNRALALSLVKLHTDGALPERVTHNDTKLNNVLIDNQSQEAVCVIDLDTVMAGLSPYDFGDLVRSSTNPAAEDEPDLSKVYMQLPLFKALASGFVSSAGKMLTPEEIRNMGLGGQVMTFECGIRFLTDFLQGDVYFKTHRKNQNADRCRTQFKMVQSMQDQEAAIRSFLKTL